MKKNWFVTYIYTTKDVVSKFANTYVNCAEIIIHEMVEKQLLEELGYNRNEKNKVQVTVLYYRVFGE